MPKKTTEDREKYKAITKDCAEREKNFKEYADLEVERYMQSLKKENWEKELGVEDDKRRLKKKVKQTVKRYTGMFRR